MQFQNSFEVEADPDAVYRFLLDVSEVVTCVPGAELTDVVDGDTYNGRMRVKVGAITTSYKGTASIIDRDQTARSATLKAKGRETTGAGAATMQASLSVVPTQHGSTVSIGTDLTITGRVAQFGRGVIEDVSKHLIDQMANCIKQKIERPPLPDASGERSEAPGYRVPRPRRSTCCWCSWPLYASDSRASFGGGARPGQAGAESKS